MYQMAFIGKVYRSDVINIVWNEVTNALDAKLVMGVSDELQRRACDEY